MLKTEFAIRFAKIQLSSAEGDLDCAAWGLQDILALNPDNVEAATVLEEIIAEIDRRFNVGDHRGTECHIIMERDSPSPYVRAMESAQVGN